MVDVPEEELLEEATAPLLPPLQANRKNGHNRASKTTTLFFIIMLSPLTLCHRNHKTVAFVVFPR